MKIKSRVKRRSHFSLLGCSGPSLYPVFTSTFHSCFLQGEPLPFFFLLISPYTNFLTYSTTLYATNFLRVQTVPTCPNVISRPHFIIAYLTLVSSIKRFSKCHFFPFFGAFTCLPLLDQWLCQVKEWRVEWRTCHCSVWGPDISGMKFSDSLSAALSSAQNVLKKKSARLWFHR